MWRSFSSVEAPGAAAVLALACACAMAACAPEVEIGMRQPIAMGPWKFDVHHASDRTESRGGRQLKIVTVHLELLDDGEPHGQPFDDFLNGRSSFIIAYPHLKLQDASGTSFDGWLVPASGDSRRSREWRAEFVLVPSSTSNLRGGDAIDLAPRYLATRLSDLSLVLDNPDRRQGQPGQVTVKLK